MDSSDDMFRIIFKPNQLDKASIQRRTADVADRIFADLFLAEAARLAGTGEEIDVGKLANMAVSAAKIYADSLVERNLL